MKVISIELIDLEKRLGTLPDWYKYAPNEIEYITCSGKFNVLAALHKIEEVYTNYCNARASVYFAYQDDYGKMIDINSVSSQAFIRAYFLQNALVLYNICIDLSWQVLWLYYGEDNDELLEDRKVYELSLRQCNLEALKYTLTLANERKIRDYIDCKIKSELWENLRCKYNYYKHRGMFYIPGLGLNEKCSSILTINNTRVKLFYRETFEMSEWTEKILGFHIDFREYFDNIIRMI